MSGSTGESPAECPGHPVLRIPTEWGEFSASFSAVGLVETRFPDRAAELQGPPAKQSDPWPRQTAAALKAILRGAAVPQLPPFDLRDATAFQRSVWDAMLRIPAGRTQSYRELADAIGNPGATRAVGTACGANPIPVIIPCHRVVAAKGLGGFSAGMAWKERLLEVEGVLPRRLF